MTEVLTDDRIAAVTPLPIDTSREQGLAGGCVTNNDIPSEGAIRARIRTYIHR